MQEMILDDRHIGQSPGTTSSSHTLYMFDLVGAIYVILPTCLLALENIECLAVGRKRMDNPFERTSNLNRMITTLSFAQRRQGTWNA